MNDILATAAQPRQIGTPFAEGDPKTTEMARRAGSVSSPRKRLAAICKSYRARYPELGGEQARGVLLDMLGIFLELDKFKEWNAREAARLFFLSEQAIQDAGSARERLDIAQRNYRLINEMAQEFFSKKEREGAVNFNILISRAEEYVRRQQTD